MRNMKIHINQIKILNINTKEVAEFLSEQKGCKVVLGSATPTIETYYKALIGELEFIRAKFKS